MAQKPAEQHVNSQEQAERNVLVHELLSLWQAFNPRHQNNVSKNSSNTDFPRAAQVYDGSLRSVPPRVP